MYNRVMAFIACAELWIIDAIILVSVPIACFYIDACLTHTGVYRTLCVPRQ